MLFHSFTPSSGCMYLPSETGPFLSGFLNQISLKARTDSGVMKFFPAMEGSFGPAESESLALTVVEP